MILSSALVLTSGCLNKLEDLTSDTRRAVIETRDIIASTRDDQHLGAYVVLMDTSDSPSIRQLNAVNVMWLAPIDQLFGLFGAPLPLEEEMFDVSTPNVTLVGSESDPGRGTGTGGVSPRGWADRATACNLAMSKILKDLTNVNSLQTDRDAVPDRARRCFLVCTAVAGAFPQNWEDPVRAEKAWPRDANTLATYKKVKENTEKLILEILPQLALNAEQEKQILSLIDIKLRNNYPVPVPPPALPSATP